MKYSYFLLLFLGFATSCLFRAVAYGEETDSVRLLNRTPVVSPKVHFNTQTQSWLDRKLEVRVAIWGEAWPPMHLGLDSAHFEGATADVLGALEQTLGVRFKIVRYLGREDAMQALVAGEIEILAFNDTGQPSDSRVRQSVAYLVNHRVVIRRTSDAYNTDPKMANERLAYVGSSLLEKQLMQRYPLAKLMRYRNRTQALTAVVYGQADAMYTSSTTAAYLIPQMFPNLLYFDHIKDVPDVGNINFAVSAKQPELLDAINQSLSAISLSEMLRIASRWELSEDFVIPRKPLRLSAEQQTWAMANPEIRVIVSALDAPLTFYDKHGQLHGLSVDLLKQIERSTGLRFEFIRGDGVGDMIGRVQREQADLIVALSVVGSVTGPLHYTRPYLMSPLVVVTRREQANIHGLDDLHGRRLAIVRDTPGFAWLGKHHPSITAVAVENTSQGLEMLISGEVDGSVQSQFVADYFIKQYFQADLHVASVFGPRPDRIVMAAASDKQILKDIINEALLDIPPERLRQLTDRWYNHDAPAIASSWSTYKNEIYTVIGGGALFALIFVLWNYYLRRQVRRRQRAEEALKDQLEFTRTLIDGSPVALYVRDQHGRLIHCNQAYLDFMQASREEFVGKTLLENSYVAPWLVARYHQMYLEVVKTGKPVVADLDVDVKGQPFHIYHWILPFQDGMGRYRGVIGGWLDITERVKLLQQLQQAKEQAVEASRSKSVFLTTMSHEIRTPISAVVGLIELLRLRTDDPEKMAQNLDVAYQSAQSLLALIGDILDLSKIEANVLEPSFRATDLEVLIQSVHRLFEANARKKNLEYKLLIDVTHRGVMIDSLMLNQIISNLLSNAIKFTEQGIVQLVLREDMSRICDGYASYEIQVQDSGSGLSDADQEVIFEPFVQAGGVQQRRDGSGLGLNICQRLAKLLGATLSVESDLGKGSCFLLRFEAPLVHVDTQPQLVPLQSASTHRLRILVAEDHAPSRLLLCQQLEYLGHEVVPCDDGESALNVWAHASLSFDLTIADCNMPNMDGFELSSRIRAIEEEKAEGFHPIFGLTANAQSSAVEKGLAAGMTKCLFKPVSIEELSSLIGEISRSSELQAKAAGANNELEKLRILKPEAYDDLVEEILRTLREDSLKLAEIGEGNDLKALARLAHKIKGGAQLAGDAQLVKVCQVLEDGAEKGDKRSFDNISLALHLLDALQMRLLAES
ncbi:MULTISPECIES: transporter substrate-binding domain-containing protein [unclassified Shewanella]|uniref:transporter substrate-binding domain-containing protein n=1 Tax=unclassified Shewanella TaxID=196818 RepID=UPI0021D8AB64|nr:MULTISPECIES: transporter substrate-binding domain-containing protein [unclassified Shewanella]MCU8076889.1 transporter substrate-binding domain-containing protein [Shewanella sp. SM29]MCU8083846.1 transporter substrate-binding domain-containing protein [Shewanella sp. SM23]